MGSSLPSADHSDSSSEKTKEEEFGKGHIVPGLSDGKGVTSFDASFEENIDYVTIPALKSIFIMSQCQT